VGIAGFADKQVVPFAAIFHFATCGFLGFLLPAIVTEFQRLPAFKLVSPQQELGQLKTVATLQTRL